MEENYASRMLLNGYQPVLRWVLDHKKTFLAIPLAIVISSVFAAKKLGREFMPPWTKVLSSLCQLCYPAWH